MPLIAARSRKLLAAFSGGAGLETSGRAGAAGRDLLLSGAGGEEAWLMAAPPPNAAHPWDEAHRALADPTFLGFEAAGAPAYVEPDFEQRFPYRTQDDPSLESLAASAACRFAGPDADWPTQPDFAWHLRDEFTGLRAARTKVGDPAGRRVRIAILDTGYDPVHNTLPHRLLTELQRNFAGGDPRDATDPGRHFPLNNPGHGTATLALLAGRRVKPPHVDFDDFLGGAPFAEIVPVRIADSVIHFATSAMAAGLNYAVDQGCDVVSISMGGVPARAWATAVNRAYEAGVAIFAAAGNRIGPAPPKTIVWPARFGRVVAVCGVLADKTPYFRPGLHRQMHGCFGPAAKMATALAAFTPNAPWAMMGCGELVSGDGAGTSSATPQAAAAAALWLQHVAVPASVQPWQRVEAVRQALFSSADKSGAAGSNYFGQGMLRARLALDVPFNAHLRKTPTDSVSFPWLRLALGLEAGQEPTGAELMFEVEALQIYEQSADLQKLTGDADPQSERLDFAASRRLLEGLRSSPLSSQSLRKHSERLSRRR